MSFDNYKNLSQVLQKFEIIASSDHWLVPDAIEIRAVFIEELEFSLREFAYEESEYAVCETIIFPVLKEIYRHHKEHLTLWSHKSIFYDENLCGIPDYLIARRSPLGKQVFAEPFLAAVEAKKDDFLKGWGQCLAEMVGIQKINKSPKQTVFGIVTNGQFWQFGKLTNQNFTQELSAYTISDLNSLMGALNTIFRICTVEAVTFD